MADSLSSALVPCPTCGSKDITLREIRSIQVYFRQRSGPPPSGESFYHVLYHSGEGCLYETRSETLYQQDVQALCHACGLKWILTDTKSVGDLKCFHDSGEPPVESRIPESSQKRKIKAVDVVKDIQRGVSDPELMKRYDVTSKQLELLLQKLLNKGLVTQQQLDDRLSLADTTVTKAFVDTQKSVEELDEDYPGRPSTSRSFRVFPHPLAPAKKQASSQPRKTIRTHDIVNDLEAGVDDSALMDKYGLSPQQLELIFKKLLDAGLITVEQLYGRTSISGTAITKAFVDVYQSLAELDD
ncbi:MAG: hypothetical protein AB1646_04940 [Thermodesulfobacteriota bacterium]